MSKLAIFPLFILSILLFLPHNQAQALSCNPESGPCTPTGYYLEYVDAISIETTDDGGITATIMGEYPNSCINAVNFTASRDWNVFTIIESANQPGILAPCLQVITPFSKTIPLNTRGLSAGEYVVKAGPITRTFYLGETESSECIIPESGPWPSCATGDITPEPPSSDPTCVIPDSGPWPPCATGGNAPPPAPDPTCVIPESGPWPQCAR